MHTFGQAPVITDLVVLYVLKGRQFYREKKYDHAIDPEKAYSFQVDSLSSSEDDSKGSYTTTLEDSHVV